MPRINDGSLLFLQQMLSKMKLPECLRGTCFGLEHDLDQQS